MNDAYIYDSLRTPRGRGKASGALHATKPISLVTGLLGALRERNPELDAGSVDDVVLGCVTPVGEQGINIARTAALAAGLPDTAAGFQLDRACASGLEAVNLAAMKVRSGWEQLVIAGGVESMSRVAMGSQGGPWAMDPETSLKTNFVPQGVSADLLATLEGFSREEVDAYAVQSQQRAAAAWDAGAFSRSVVPVNDVSGLEVLDRDEHLRPGATVESLAGLEPSFATMGRFGGFDAIATQTYPHLDEVVHIHTAGNSSGIVDGAALTLVGSREAGERNGLAPRARIVAAAVSGAEPTVMMTGPSPAMRKALDLAGMTIADIDLFEVNEAFAVVPLNVSREFDLDPERVNVNGGAIAMGHPLGATGSILLGTVLDELERQDLQTGLVTLCVAAGMGIATIIERV
jgi:acetyl-CoA C-acetyltransferase